MYIIDYNEDINKYFIKFFNVDFFDAVEELKRYYIYYNKIHKLTIIDNKRILDIIEEFNYDKIEYEVTEKASYQINLFIESFKSEQEYFRRVVFDKNILKPNIILKQYQEYCLQYTLSRKRSFIADEAGLGKTLEAICTFSQWYKNGKVDKIFIVVRTGLSYNWKEEILSKVNIFNEEDIAIIDKTNKKDIFKKNKDKKIIIAPNHLLKHIFLYYKPNTNVSKSAKNIKWKSFVDIKEHLEVKNLCLIIDEAHELTNSKGVNTKALLAHIKYFDYRIGLSATPHGNKFEKYFNIMELLDSGKINTTEIAFRYKIANEIGTYSNKHDIVDYNIDVIQKFKNKTLSFYLIKRLKKDLPEMKYERIIKPIYLDMSKKQRKLYELFLQDEINKLELEEGSITLKKLLNKFIYLLMVVDNPFLLKNKIEHPEINKLLDNWEFTDDERFNVLKILLKSYIDNNNEKVIVCDNHPRTLNALAEEFKKYNPLVLHGEMKYDDKDKKRIQDLFNDKTNSHKLMLMNPTVGGVGFNFNTGSRRIIFYVNANDAVLMEQTMDRIYRITNEIDAIIEIFIYNNSIDMLRYRRNINNIKLNQHFLSKDLSRQELKNLLNMNSSTII
jgi:superfamily II DNA or RNA helicase